MFKDFFDDFYDLFFNSSRGLSRVARTRNIWNGLAVYLLVSLIVSLATVNFNLGYRMEQDLFSVPPEIVPFFSPEMGAGVSRFVPLVTLLTQLVFGPLYFLLTVAVRNFTAELLGGRSNPGGLGAVLGYGQLPYLVVALGGLLNRYTAFNTVGLLTLAALLWSLWLKIAGLRIVHEFTWGRAVLCYFMPLLAVLTAFVLFLLLAVVFLFPVALQFVEKVPGAPALF
ncbi:MAG: hypothetical protein GX334_07190 [Firmicutes bacterium]|nr:hypothetical protein [Bacillota bacterium]